MSGTSVGFIIEAASRLCFKERIPKLTALFAESKRTNHLFIFS